MEKIAIPSQSWQPTASIENIKKRAEVYTQIRQFFSERNILEVETPLLCQHTITDIYIESFKTEYQSAPIKKSYFLQTSPEYAMKRLLTHGIGAIYQICKAFRQGDFGRQHNPEFTLLEWYRPDFNHHQLMDEVDNFLQLILKSPKAEKISYELLFKRHVDLNPFLCTKKELYDFIHEKKLLAPKQIVHLDKDTCLQVILSHLIEPNLGKTKPIFVYDFPSTQAALAKVRDDNPPVAERFELYINGMEIANGFHELSNAKEQRHRFMQDQDYRKHHQQFIPDIDERFISALDNNFPECSGVALGIDRLLMILTNTNKIADILTFPWDRA